MRLTAIELEDNEVSPAGVLASMILGRGRGSVTATVEKSRSVSFRLDPSIVDEIDSFAQKAAISRTAVVEMLLVYGIRKVKEEIEFVKENYMDEVE